MSSLHRTLREAMALGRAMFRRRHPGGRSRRGSVIILAMAALAVIAVAGVAYVTIVQLDRSSTTAYSRTVNYQQQVKAVVSHMQAQLAADLFGNKIVTTATPRRADPNNPFSPSLIPRMFEDYEFWDAPRVAFVDEGGAETFDVSDPEVQPPNPSPGARLDVNGANGRGVALPDDAWLASIEPAPAGDSAMPPNPGSGAVWQTWPQITNLDAAYRLVDLNNNPANPDYRWVRGRGRFVDLAQWFFDPDNGRGNPAADLEPNTLDDDRVGSIPNDARAGINQRVFIESISEPASPDSQRYEPADLRFWADADGDGFPDARWQRLEALGDLFGLRWVVAARIVDNSAMANVNAHIGLGGWIPGASPDEQKVGDGLTPADVDLFRLFEMFGGEVSERRHTDADRAVRADLLLSFAEHVDRGIAARAIIDQVTDPDLPASERLRDLLFHHTPMAPIIDGYNAQGFTRAQREAIWRYFGASPRRPVVGRGVGYALNDEIDLRAYNGFNYESMLSRLEQMIDGPESLGRLPGLIEPQLNRPIYGLLRSASRDAAAPYRDPSQFDIASTRQRAERIRRDVRRMLTTVNGPGDFSPISPLSDARDPNNTQRSLFDNASLNRKVDVNRLGRSASPSDKSRLVRESFEAFTWALAPFATNAPMMRGIRPSDLASIAASSANLDYHYGGGDRFPESPASIVQNAAAPYGGAGATIGPSYALLRSASLAVNLADAVDGGPEATIVDEPTIARLFPSVTQTDDPNSYQVELGVRFSHGDVGDVDGNPTTPPDPPLIMSPEYVGADQTGVTLVGLERQPFLRMAASLAAYRDMAVRKTSWDEDGVVGVDPEVDDAINGYDSTDEALLGVIAVEVGNPWPTSISLTDFIVRIGVAGDAAYQEFAFPDGAVISAGDYAVYHFAMAKDDANVVPVGEGMSESSAEAESLFIQWADGLAEPGSLHEEPLVPVMGGFVGADDPMAPRHAIFFYDLLDEAAAEPAVVTLFRRIGPDRYIVDRMRHKTTGGGVNTMTTFPAGLTSSYSLAAAGQYATGYVAVSGSVTRATTRGVSGFPAYVLEVDPEIAGPGSLTSQVNTFKSFETPIVLPNAWTLPDPALPMDPKTSITTALTNIADVINAEIPLSVVEKVDANTTFNSLFAGGSPSFQMFVPDSDLAYASELHMISAFTHMCREHMLDEPLAWTTVGEQLGRRENLYYDGMFGGMPNPYIGVLDPSRYVPGGDLEAPNPLPDALAVPLAVRVFDCFETLRPPERLVNGRVNINTAPREVLDILPMMTPRAPFSSAVTTAPLLSTSPNFRTQRVLRHRYDPMASGQLTAIPGFRQSELVPNPAPSLPPPFVSIGELPVLAEWDPATGGPTGSNSTLFLEVGSGGVNDYDVPSLGPIDMRASADISFDPIDDPEERLTIFRAMSNIVSTRSDVFTAWFVIRGYDPERIETTRLNQFGGNEEVAFNSIRPTFEQRWLVVFDRSNVSRPADRPHVLLLVQLPTDEPLYTDPETVVEP